MGVVYKARDTHLDRPVAIKLLRSEAVTDPERKRRFVQEAKAASALNHPNIITIYDIDAAGGTDFIAMEYVTGKTLGHLIGGKGLPLGETLTYAVQAADALARAHAAGIIHRDLKPANIMVNDHGLVKLLDFGLAKLTDLQTDDEMTVSLDRSPRTREGTIVGTVAYMSPEQAQGKPVDARSDIFSFGSVLYETITGRRPFERDTNISTLTAILHDDPGPIGERPDAAHPELERIVLRCLRKDPNRRFHHMIDLKVALEELKEESESGRPVVAARPVVSPPRRWLAPALAVMVAAAGAAAGGSMWWLSRSRSAAPPELVLTRLTSDSGLAMEPALSPDGNLVAYSSDRGDGHLDIWVQQVPGGEPVRLTSDPADDREPSFSPDGRRIAFRSDREGGGVYVASALGGEARLIAPGGRRPRFSPDGTKVAYWVGSQGGSTDGEVYIVDSTGGEPRRLQTGTAFSQSPLWSPSGKYILFVGGTGLLLAGESGRDWWVAPVEGGQAVKTGAIPALSSLYLSNVREAGEWVAGGNRVVFAATLGDSTNLWDVRVSPEAGSLEGPPRRLTTGPGPDLYPFAAGGGRVVFSSLVENLDVWSLPMDVNQGKVTGEPRRVTQEAATDGRPSVSADGKKLGFLSDRSGNFDVWVKDLENGKETAVTLTPLDEDTPAISRDGSKVAYTRQEGQKRSIYVAPVGRSGVPVKVCESCGGSGDWLSDTRILFARRGQPTRIGPVDLASGHTIDLVQHPQFNVYSGRSSLDNRWIAFHRWTGPMTRRIYVAPFRDGATLPEHDWIPITDGLGLDRDVCWSPDGNLLYFYSERDGFRCVWAQRLDATTKRPKGGMFSVHHLHHARRSLMRITDVDMARLTAVPGRLVLSLGEYAGNIWMGEFRTGK